MLWNAFQLLFMFLCFSLFRQDVAGIVCKPGQMATPDRKRCISCLTDQYSSTSGDHIECYNCVVCGAYSKVHDHCTPTKNTKCRCEPGFESSFDSTQEVCKCKKGFGIKTIDGLRICQKCENGTFTKDDNSVCKAWTQCDGNGVKQVGNSTSDVVCVNAPTVEPTVKETPTPISVFVQSTSAKTITAAPLTTRTSTNSIVSTPAPSNGTEHSLWLLPLASVLGLLLIQFAVIKLKLKACFNKNKMQMVRQDSACGKPVEESGVEKMI